MALVALVGSECVVVMWRVTRTSSRKRVLRRDKVKICGLMQEEHVKTAVEAVSMR